MPPKEPVKISPWSLSFGKKICFSSAFRVKKYQFILVLGYTPWFHGQAARRLFDGTLKPHSSRPAGILSSTSWSLEPMRNKQSFLHRWLSASSSSIPQSDSEISIFTVSSNFQLDLLWTHTLTASVGNHFFHFYMALASGSCCWKSSPPRNRDCTFQGEVIASSSLFSLQETLLSSKYLPKQKKLTLQSKMTQVLTWQIVF